MIQSDVLNFNKMKKFGRDRCSTLSVCLRNIKSVENKFDNEQYAFKRTIVFVREVIVVLVTVGFVNVLFGKNGSWPKGSCSIA